MQYTQREKELIELALDFYSKVNKGTAGAHEVKILLDKLRFNNGH